MNLQDLITDCDKCIKHNIMLSLVWVKGRSIPSWYPDGFPCGILLCENSSGDQVYQYNPSKVKKWAENMLNGMSYDKEGA